MSIIYLSFNLFFRGASFVRSALLQLVFLSVITLTVFGTTLSSAEAKGEGGNCEPDETRCDFARCLHQCSAGINATSSFVEPKIDLYSWSRPGLVTRGKQTYKTLRPGRCAYVEHYPEWPNYSRVCARMEMLDRYRDGITKPPGGGEYKNPQLCMWSDEEDPTDGALVFGSKNSPYPYRTPKSQIAKMDLAPNMMAVIGFFVSPLVATIVDPKSVGRFLLGTNRRKNMNESTGPRINQWRNPRFWGRLGMDRGKHIKEKRSEIKVGGKKYDVETFSLKGGDLKQYEMPGDNGTYDMEWGEKEQVLRIHFSFFGLFSVRTLEHKASVREGGGRNFWVSDNDFKTYNELRKTLAPGCAPVPMGPFPPPWGARAFFPMPMAALPVPIIDWADTHASPKVKIMWCLDDAGNEVQCDFADIIRDVELRLTPRRTTVPYSVKDIALSAVPDDVRISTGKAFFGKAKFNISQTMPAMVRWFNNGGGTIGSTGIRGASPPQGFRSANKVDISVYSEVSVDDPTEICTYYAYKDDPKDTEFDPHARYPLSQASLKRTHCIKRSVTMPMPHIKNLEVADGKPQQCNAYTIPGVKIKIPTDAENTNKTLDWDAGDDGYSLDSVSTLDIEDGELCLENGSDYTAFIVDSEFGILRRCAGFVYADGTVGLDGSSNVLTEDPDRGSVICKAFDAVACLQGYDNRMNIAVDATGSVIEGAPNVEVLVNDKISYRYLPPKCLSPSSGGCENYITGCYSWDPDTGCDPVDNHISPLFYTYEYDPDTNVEIDRSGQCDGFGEYAGIRKCVDFMTTTKYDPFLLRESDMGLGSLPPESMGLCERVAGNLFYTVGDLDKVKTSIGAVADDTLARVVDKLYYECTTDSICSSDPNESADITYTGKIASTYMCYQRADSSDTSLMYNQQIDAVADGYSAGCDVDLDAVAGVAADNETSVFASIDVPAQGPGREREVYNVDPNITDECAYVLVQAWGSGGAGGDRRSGSGGGYAEVIIKAEDIAGKSFKILTGDSGDVPETDAPRPNYYRYNIPKILDDAGNELVDVEPVATVTSPVAPRSLADGQDTVVMLDDELLILAEGGMYPTDYNTDSLISEQIGERPPGGRAFVNLDIGGGSILQRVYMSEGGRGFLADNNPALTSATGGSRMDEKGVTYTSALSFQENANQTNVKVVRGGSSGPFYADIIGTVGQRVSADTEACYESFCETCNIDPSASSIVNTAYTDFKLEGPAGAIPAEFCKKDFILTSGNSVAQAPALNPKWAIYPYVPDPLPVTAANPAPAVPAGTTCDSVYNTPSGLDDPLNDHFIFEEILKGKPTYGSGGCTVDQVTNATGWPGATVFHCIRDLTDDRILISETENDAISAKEVNFADVVTKISENNNFITPLSVAGEETACDELEVLLRDFDSVLHEWVYYTCELPNVLHGQSAPANACKTVADSTNVTYTIIPVENASSPGTYTDTGEKKVGGRSYAAHGVWRHFPQPPMCDAGKWRF